MKAQVWIIHSQNLVLCQQGEGVPANADNKPLCTPDDLVGTFDIPDFESIFDPSEKRTWGDAPKALRAKASELGYDYNYDEWPRIVKPN